MAVDAMAGQVINVIQGRKITPTSRVLPGASTPRLCLSLRSPQPGRFRRGLHTPTVRYSQGICRRTTANLVKIEDEIELAHVVKERVWKAIDEAGYGLGNTGLT